MSVVCVCVCAWAVAGSAQLKSAIKAMSYYVTTEFFKQPWHDKKARTVFRFVPQIPELSFRNSVPNPLQSCADTFLHLLLPPVRVSEVVAVSVCSKHFVYAAVTDALVLFNVAWR